MSEQAKQFLKSIIAAFPRFPTSKETTAEYWEVLKRKHYLPEVWENAKAAIVQEHEGDNLPSIAEIVRQLSFQNGMALRKSNFGYLSFISLEGRCLVMRVKHNGSDWVQYGGKRDGLKPELPLGAHDIVINPDSPVERR